MASLALGLAGAGIGSFFGPLGTSIGWGLGAMLGARLGHKAHQSPQIKDLRVQTSEYGTPIPIGYGTIRIAGFLEWAADKVPHKNKQGGKGGPKVTTTTYTCSFAIGLLETSFLDYSGTLVNNPILGILRVWANGRLVWGEGSPADALPMTIYYGTEDQLPDPTIEAKEGVGQVSANRGKAYVVFTDLELAQFGDAIPNFTFEVVASGAIELQYYSRWPVDYDFPIDGTIYSYPHRLNGVDSSVRGQLTLHRYRSGFDYGVEMSSSADSTTLYYDQSTYDLQGTLLSSEAQATTLIPATTGFIAQALGSMNNGIGYIWWQQSIAGNAYITFAWFKDGVQTFTPLDLVGGAIDRTPGLVGPLLYWNGFIYAIGGGTGVANILRFPAPDGSCYVEVPDVVFPLNDYTRDGGGANPADLIIGDDGYLYCRVSYAGGVSPIPGVLGGWGTKLLRLDADLNLVADWYDPALMTGGVTTALGAPGYTSAVVYRGHFIAYHLHGVFDSDPHWILYQIAADTLTFAAELQVITPTSDFDVLIYIGGGLAAYRGGIIQLGSSTITLGEMVANVSQHVGYAPDEYDVTQLTDVVRGACISQRTSGRAAIEAWQPAYGFGAVESNFANKFVKWGGEVVATIPDTDLGAHEYGSDGGDPVKRTLTTDKDLPRTVEVVFLNKAMDYQEGMQYWEGPVQSDTRVALTMALVLTDSEGKAIAENIGVNGMVERQQFQFSLPRKWAHLEPTDVIALNEQPVRIVKKDEQGYTHIALDGISTRIGEWISAPPASQVDYVQQVPPTAVRTDLWLLDTALARDSDFQLGFNSAMAGATSASWPGAGLYRSVDGGATYDLVTAAAEADTFGTATTVLGDFGGGNIVDESSTLTVFLTPGSGDLTSTNELGLLNGANLFALGTEANGYELAQFRDATLMATTSGGSKTYELSGFLRGRRGTEWALATHATNDRFVLFPAHNVDGEFSDLGIEYLYKAVTSGGTLSSATAVPFTNHGIALKPYAPVLLGGGRNAAGDIILNWTRRTRIGGSWTDNVDVPLSESVEFYYITIYSDSSYTTVKREGAVPGATTLTYTAALQTTDFGSPQTTLYWTIQQLGSYGNGYAARGIT